jgi:hypothetical protein
LEAADLPDGVELADVALRHDAQPHDDGDISELLGVPAVSVAGIATRTSDASQRLYSDAAADPAPPTQTAVELRAIPYFTWANRDTGAMRVWVPVQESA